ncbi:MAG: hypothetical protein ACHQWV_01145 [Nitrospirales bacterium]
MPPMEWDYVKTLGIVGLLALVIQLLVFVWENWLDTRGQGLVVPVTLRQVLIEWATYMLLFIVVSMILAEMLHLTCSIC